MVTARWRHEEKENMRYAMRVWLLAMGFIGDECREVRRLLLADLPGDSAFKDDEMRRRWRASQELAAQEAVAE